MTRMAQHSTGNIRKIHSYRLHFPIHVFEVAVLTIWQSSSSFARLSVRAVVRTWRGEPSGIAHYYDYLHSYIFILHLHLPSLFFIRHAIGDYYKYIARFEMNMNKFPVDASRSCFLFFFFFFFLHSSFVAHITAIKRVCCTRPMREHMKRNQKYRNSRSEKCENEIFRFARHRHIGSLLYTHRLPDSNEEDVLEVDVLGNNDDRKMDWKRCIVSCECVR